MSMCEGQYNVTKKRWVLIIKELFRDLTLYVNLFVNDVLNYYSR